MELQTEIENNLGSKSAENIYSIPLIFLISLKIFYLNFKFSILLNNTSLCARRRPRRIGRILSYMICAKIKLN